VLRSAVGVVPRGPALQRRYEGLAETAGTYAPTIKNRFRDTKVKLGSRRLYATLEQLKHHFEGESPDQIRLPVIFVRPYELGTHSAFTEYARIAGEGNLLVSG
jgi:hypothetical protein